MTLFALLKEFVDDTEGQGIVEYGAILAFVSLLIAAVFGFANGSLANALSQSLSHVVFEFNRLNTGAGS